MGKHRNPSVAQYVVGRLADLGIKHVFGVPGDFAFTLDDAIEEHPDVEFIVSANELNAAYAADGYARVHGAAMLTTTYGVGELSALNGVMGSKAENLPVFHLVGAPSTRVAQQQLPLHHTLGKGDDLTFRPISASACCVSTLLTPGNCVSEMERVIREALEARQPAYLLMPIDLSGMCVHDKPVKGVPLSKVPPLQSDAHELSGAVEALTRRFSSARHPIILATFRLQRYGLGEQLREVLDATGIPFATTAADKGSGPEQHPGFLGMYKGEASAPGVRAAVEGADLVLDLGGCVFDDLSTGFSTACVSRNAVLSVTPSMTHMVRGAGLLHPAGTSFSPVWMGDVLDALVRLGRHPHADAAANAARDACASAEAGNGVRDAAAKQAAAERSAFNGHHVGAGPADGDGDGSGVSQGITWGQVGEQLKALWAPGDVMVVETGNASISYNTLPLPDGAAYHNQTIWGSIGWATPAAFGAALADRGRRVVCVTGDGSFQLTANELGAMGRYGARPLIILLNNEKYGVEEFLEGNKCMSYNDIARWRYAELPGAMGCADWLSLRARTEAQLEDALKRAAAHHATGEGGGVMVEVVMGQKLLPPLTQRQIEREYRKGPVQEER